MEHYATAAQVFAAGLVFARVGAFVLIMPGVSASGVPAMARLAFALLLSLCLYPIAKGALPAEPANTVDLYGLIIREILIGLMMGAILQMFMMSLSTAGELVSLQTTLSFSQTANPLEAQPSTSISTFLALLGLTLVFAANLDHYFLSALFKSYEVFAPAKAMPVGDAAQLAVQTAGKSFALGIQMAAPVIVFALVFNVATGLIGRVMPQFQIFFVAAPLQVLLGLSVFALSLGSMIMVWIDRYQSLAGLFSPITRGG